MPEPKPDAKKRSSRQPARRRNAATSEEPSPQGTTEPLLRSVQRRARRILEAALGEKVISESPHQRTGGGYQTVRLGESVREGFRIDRPNLLKGFEIEGRAVCDLGANLGEISRDLRRAGASQVDAYEYDAFFTQIARYITAYNGLADIDHFEADVSAEGFLRRTYDVCVGLSAYSFMQKNIDYICERVSECMIIETHEVRDETWPARYVEPIVPHFPHWCCFGTVTHGKRGSQKRRLWLAFSKQPLTPFHSRRAASVVPGAEGVVEIDLGRSTLTFLDKAELPLERRAEPFSKASLRLYSERLDEYERRFAAGEEIELRIAGEPYWLALMCGLAEFDGQGLEEDNTYLKWMTRGVAAGVVDPGLRPLLDDRDQLHRKVSLRLAALGRALRERDVRHFGEVLIAYNPTPFHPAMEGLNFKVLALSGSDELLCGPRVNGHHRLFVMKMLDIESAPMMPIWDLESLGPPKAFSQGRSAVQRVRNYERRIYQYLAGVDVDDPVVATSDDPPAG